MGGRVPLTAGTGLLDVAAKRYWEAYLATLPAGDRPEDPFVTASMAGDERVADDLLQLYLDGAKHAASGLVEEYRRDGDALPRVGNYWVVLDSSNIPRCILRTVNVVVHPFDEVTEDIAVAEGEGDRSLEDWRKLHRWFYAPYLERLGIEDLEAAEVVTEFFVLVFP